VSGFSAGWLTLREPYDTAARNSALAASLNAAQGAVPVRRILDLASGTGANLRYLAPRLGGDQHWLLVDHDTSLLSSLPQEMARWVDAHGYSCRAGDETLTVSGPAFSASIRWRQLDLAAAVDRLVLPGWHLVTASALLDLVSADWLERLADACRGGGCAALFALTYNGHIAWSPTDRDDALLRALLNRHQNTDKGFGPALGPGAARTAEALFAARGYRTESVITTWQIGARDGIIQSRLIDDWSAAAAGISLPQAARIEKWRSRRLRQVARGISRLGVGHIDLLALPD
jgi:hypothetical protein